MKQQPDKLFRVKLENFQLNAPANAWSKIEAGLDKPSRKAFWLKIAAGSAVFVTAGILFWSSSLENNDILAIESADPQAESLALQSTGEIQESVAELPVVSLTTEMQQKQESPQTTTKKINAEHQDNTLLIQSTLLEEENTDYAAAVAVVPYAVEADQSVSEKEVFTQESSASVYLVYTADEVNEKYLRQPVEDDATSQDKKTSRIQMLMSVANNLKNGDGGFTDLRQKKDEIFALNFLDDKKQLSKKN